jgi:tetratricopeptide (TPR) repeat protein
MGESKSTHSLVRARDDVPLWSGKFDRESRDIFAVQDEISRSIVNALRLKLGRGQRRYNANLEAYELYLRARAHADPVGAARARIATDLFEQVIARDPAFAPAYAGLADAWAAVSRGRGELSAPPDQAFAVMEPAAQKALELDPLLAEGHAAMGVVLARDRKWKDAEAAFGRAIDLNPNLSSVRLNFAMSTLLPQGKVDESLRQVRAALAADPLSLDVQRFMAYVLVSAGTYDESIAISRRHSRPNRIIRMRVRCLHEHCFRKAISRRRSAESRSWVREARASLDIRTVQPVDDQTRKHSPCSAKTFQQPFP